MAPGAHPGGVTGREAENGFLIAHSLRADGFDASEDGTGRGTPLIPVLDLGGNKGMNGGGWSLGMTPPLGTNEAHAVMTLAIRGRGDSHDLEYRDAGIANAVLQPGGGSVRRLTPRECARLQGFPDDWCAIAYRGKPAADGPMYRAYGNSMAVPVIGWVLSRVQQIAAASLEEAA
jgi:DNA (cytosine-5)-methyltransferase 1